MTVHKDNIYSDTWRNYRNKWKKTESTTEKTAISISDTFNENKRLTENIGVRALWMATAIASFGLGTYFTHKTFEVAENTEIFIAPALAATGLLLKSLYEGHKLSQKIYMD